MNRLKGKVINNTLLILILLIGMFNNIKMMPSLTQCQITTIHFVENNISSVRKNSEWSIQTIDSLGGVGACTSITLDANNYVHISYYDTWNEVLKYAIYNGKKWSTEKIELHYNEYGTSSSIGVDSNNQPHISHQHYGVPFSSDLYYSYYDGNEWQTERADSLGDLGATSLAIDQNDGIHISYVDFADHNLKYTFKGKTLVTRGDFFPPKVFSIQGLLPSPCNTYSPDQNRNKALYPRQTP